MKNTEEPRAVSRHRVKMMVELVLLALLPILAFAEEKRTFTSADGTKTFEGIFLRFDEVGGTVTVKRSGRGAMTFPITALGEEDRVYVREEAARQAAIRSLGWKPDSEDHPHGAGEECEVDFDFAERDELPQTDTPEEDWGTGWGPPANTYPELRIPGCVVDPVEFQRRRIVEAAKKYVGLPYEHKHIPAAGGLDCSNFTAWVYNYALGVRFSSAVGEQAETAGRRLGSGEDFEMGDLLFQTDEAGETITHAVIFIDEDSIIDSTKGVVAVRDFRGWYRSRLSHARRIIEEKDDTGEEK